MSEMSERRPATPAAADGSAKLERQPKPYTLESARGELKRLKVQDSDVAKTFVTIPVYTPESGQNPARTLTILRVTKANKKAGNREWLVACEGDKLVGIASLQKDNTWKIGVKETQTQNGKIADTAAQFSLSLLTSTKYSEVRKTSLINHKQQVQGKVKPVDILAQYVGIGVRQTGTGYEEVKVGKEHQLVPVKGKKDSPKLHVLLETSAERSAREKSEVKKVETKKQHRAEITKARNADARVIQSSELKPLLDRLNKTKIVQELAVGKQVQLTSDIYIQRVKGKSKNGKEITTVQFVRMVKGKGQEAPKPVKLQASYLSSVGKTPEETKRLAELRIALRQRVNDIVDADKAEKRQQAQAAQEAAKLRREQKAAQPASGQTRRAAGK